MSDPTYVSRGGQKLRHAIAEFGLDVTGLVCADLGCSTGGFTDCLLQHGASKVFAVDTAYGQLAWKLRKDPRVVVMERSNALHTKPAEEVDLVVVDLGWTTQRQLLPIAASWLKKRERAGPSTPDARSAAIPLDPVQAPQPQREPPSPLRTPCILTLIKPHYEAKHTRYAREAESTRGILPDDLAERVMQDVVEEMKQMGFEVPCIVKSPLRGGTKADGNVEWVAGTFPRT
jgi:predicted rRNA methylase YqxC with S4 and FtsJ domains